MKDFLRVFFSRPIPLVGLVIFAVIVALALLAPLLFGRGPFIIVGMPLLPPGAPGLLAGSDVLGRDMAVGLAYGARISLLVGITSTLCAVGIGVLLGAVAGYYGGWLDDLLMRVTEFFQIIPSFVLLMVLVAFLQPSLSSTVIGIALVTWPQVARVVRGEFLSLRGREFVQAARTLGMRDARIIFTQVLPNALPPIIVVGSMMVGSAILTESALKYSIYLCLKKHEHATMTHASASMFTSIFMITVRGRRLMRLGVQSTLLSVPKAFVDRI